MSRGACVLGVVLVVLATAATAMEVEPISGGEEAVVRLAEVAETAVISKKAKKVLGVAASKAALAKAKVMLSTAKSKFSLMHKEVDTEAKKKTVSSKKVVKSRNAKASAKAANNNAANVLKNAQQMKTLIAANLKKAKLHMKKVEAVLKKKKAQRKKLLKKKTIWQKRQVAEKKKKKIPGNAKSWKFLTDRMHFKAAKETAKISNTPVKLATAQLQKVKKGIASLQRRLKLAAKRVQKKKKTSLSKKVAYKKQIKALLGAKKMKAVVAVKLRKLNRKYGKAGRTRSKDIAVVEKDQRLKYKAIAKKKTMKLLRKSGEPKKKKPKKKRL